MCTKCDDKNDIIFKEEESIDILNYLTLTEQKSHAQLINISKENISQEFRL